MFAFIIAALCAAAIFLLVRPLLAQGRKLADAREHDLAVYRDQLAEIERDRARLVLDDAQAQSAKLEVERRILAAARRAEPEPQESMGEKKWLVAAIGALPVLAVLAYLFHGAPHLPSQPFAGRDQEREAAGRDQAGLVRAIAELQARLAQKPDDTQAWIMLGRALIAAGRAPDAVTAFARAVALAPDRADVLAAYGEAQVLAGGGVVSAQALEAFTSALARDAKDPRANYYAGLADAQQGRPREALQRWLDLEAAAPADAPWLGAVRAEIERVAREAKIDPLSIKPDRKKPPSVGPGADDIARMNQLSPAERQAQIRAMVESLAEKLKQEPADIEGWKRLARAWAVLGENEKALAALEQGLKAAPGDGDLLLAYIDALAGREGEKALDSPRMRAALEALLKAQPDQPLALFYLGESEARAGNGARAKALWQRLLDKMPAEAPQRALIQKRIEALPK